MTTNLKLAGKVARQVELRSITLKKATISTDLDPTSVPAEVGLMQGHRVLDWGFNASSEKKLSVSVDFKFHAHHMDGEDSLEELAALEATFLLIYDFMGEEEPDELSTRYFCEVNGPYNAWPYWRELVQSVTGRIGLASITVPVYRPQVEEIATSNDQSVDGASS